MKSKFFYLAALVIACASPLNVNAQITLPIIDPEIYVSPYGLSGANDYGVGGFTDAISPSRLMTNLNDN